MRTSIDYELTYNSWRAMRARCNNPKHTSWELYGKRGVKVCKRWRKFASFLKDMGERPSRAHTIERIDVDGNYEPRNCRWATRSEQCKNFRPIGRYAGIMIDGKRQSARDWEKQSPVSRVSITKRIKHGMPAAEAVTKPPSVSRKFSISVRQEMKMLFADGMSMADIARRFKADPSTVWRIVHPHKETA